MNESTKFTALEERIKNIIGSVNEQRSSLTILLLETTIVVIVLIGLSFFIYFQQGSFRTELTSAIDESSEDIRTELAAKIGESSEDIKISILAAQAQTISALREEIQEEIQEQIIPLTEQTISALREEFQEEIQEQITPLTESIIGVVLVIQQLEEEVLTMNDNRPIFQALLIDLERTSARFEEVGNTLTHFNNQIVDLPFYVQDTHKGLFTGDSAVAPMVSNIEHRVSLVTEKIDTITDQLIRISDRLPAEE